MVCVLALVSGFFVDFLPEGFDELLHALNLALDCFLPLNISGERDVLEGNKIIFVVVSVFENFAEAIARS